MVVTVIPGAYAAGLYDVAPVGGLKNIGRHRDPGLTPPGFMMPPPLGLENIGRHRDPGLTPPGFMMSPPVGGSKTLVVMLIPGAYAAGLYDVAPVGGWKTLVVTGIPGLTPPGLMMSLHFPTCESHQ